MQRVLFYLRVFTLAGPTVVTETGHTIEALQSSLAYPIAGL